MKAESLPMIEVDGARIVYRRIGKGRPLVILNGFGATSADWDPFFIDRLASSNELILLNNRGIGGSMDDGQPFDIAKLADDAAHVIDTSGTPNEQAHRLLFLLFPNDVAESFYEQFGDMVAAARAQLSVELLNRQSAAMDAWHRNGVASQLREIRLPVLIATGTEDIVIPASNALKLVNAIPGAWLAQFPHGGHAFIAQYPRALADLINSFLALSTAHNAE